MISTNGVVTYELIGAGGVFEINENTGVISVAKKLDREKQDTYKVGVFVNIV